jgi:CRISPR-associated protein Csd1
LRLTTPWGEPRPAQFWQLLFAIDREGEPAAHHTIALLRRGLEGRSQPLGHAMLAAVLTRLRHPGQPSPGEKGQKDLYSLSRLRVPLGLVRMCVDDLLTTGKQGETEMSEGLDPACRLPGYVCGRMMAEFENLQRAASETQLNVSILDRYFAMASTYPAVAFPKIEMLAQKHLAKLRRLPDKKGVARAIDGRLQDLHRLLSPAEGGAFPGKLGLEGQGLFILGYYHQKAWSLAQAAERKQQNDENGSANPEQEN